MFEYFNGLMPVNRLYETRRLLAFYHPKPVYPLHVLIVPKKALRDLKDLQNQPDQFYNELMQDVLCCVLELVIKLNLDENGYRLILNGGVNQEVRILHFHLVSGDIQAR